MTLREFHNALRLLHNIDSWDLPDVEWYSKFAASPVDFFIRCDDERCNLIWEVMRKKGVGQ